MKPELKIISFPKPEPKPSWLDKIKSKFKALHFFHDWGAYEVYKQGDVNDHGVKIGFYIMQLSQCKICGKARFNRIDS